MPASTSGVFGAGPLAHGRNDVVHGAQTLSSVVPAHAGTHNRRTTLLEFAGAAAEPNNTPLWLWVLACARTTTERGRVTVAPVGQITSNELAVTLVPHSHRGKSRCAKNRISQAASSGIGQSSPAAKNIPFGRKPKSAACRAGPALIKRGVRVVTDVERGMRWTARGLKTSG